MPAWGDLVYWQKNRMGHKNWIPALPWLCSLFHTHPGCCHQGNLKFPLCAFFFACEMAKIHHLTAAYMHAKIFMVSVQIKSPNISEKSFLPAAVTAAVPRCAWSQQPVQVFEQFLGWELPHQRRGKLFWGALYFDCNLPWWAFYCCIAGGNN